MTPDDTNPADLLSGLDIDLPLEDPGQARPAQAARGGEFFGPYQLLQQVGQGGVAKVMRARHIHPRYAETTFAIKILHDQLSRDPKVVELFRHEAYVLSLLKHANLVRTFEAGVQDEKLFIAMEYIDGRDLENMMSRSQRAQTPVPLPVALYIAAEVLKGLGYAHELCDADGRSLRLVHRDVNPVNVFMSYDGRVKLGDFGVASIAAVVEKNREIAGKAGYFAPEQLAGDPVDHRADIFAMGVLVFELLTGQKLFAADTEDKMMRLNKKAKIPKPSSLNPSIPKGLEEIMLRMLERKPDDRYQTVHELLDALGAFLPNPIGMQLAVAALMRKVFLAEHIQELQLREGLAGSSMARGAGQLVGVYSTDERALQAFFELLTSRGYRVEKCPNPEALVQLLISAQPPAVLLVDVCSKDFSPAVCIGALAKAGRPIPVLAVSDGLESRWVHFADAVGAVDLLFKPFNIERVLAAVRAALTGSARAPTTDSLEATSHGRTRVLLLSRDPKLITKLTNGLGPHGLDLEVSPTPEEAIERTLHASYYAVIYDANPASVDDRLFVSQYRSQPAMGLVPVLYLADPPAHSMFAGVDADRSAVRPRAEAPVVLSEVIHRLLADNRMGRIFIRYTLGLAAELRFGGRVFPGETVDISRGGLMLRCEPMPPVGTQVGVSLKPPGLAESVQVMGHVVRVDIPTRGDPRASLGIEFERFVGRSETIYINYLASLDPSDPTKQTLIMKVPAGLRPAG